MSLDEILSRYGNLPAANIAHTVNDMLMRQNSIVITAAPGAGKSTLLPLAILSGLGVDGKIVVLEPRRLAAKQIACRMASMIGEQVGHTIGYRVRLESKTSASTHIEVVTEGVLARMMVGDATLDGVGVVVFDEFHERSIHSDLALALCRQTQQIVRPDLRLVIMSATIDTASISQRLCAPTVSCKGAMFDVEVVHAAEDTPVGDIAKSVSSMVMRAYNQHQGSILAFLPGQGEIEQCMQLLSASIPNVYPLYGNLSPERQQLAMAQPAEGERKVVLATPIAETSLTIEGIRVVVDSGYFRTPVIDTHTGLGHLATARISLDMATQRTGRAGRLADGVCYRLWTLATEHRMQPQRKPELLDADLASMVLDVFAFGETDVDALPWLDAPPRANVAKAISLLVSLGAIAHNTITALGRKMVDMPCHPRISKMILIADTARRKSLACDIAAILEEKDPMADVGDSSLDLRISTLRSMRRRRTLGRWQRIAMIAGEYRRMAGVGEDNDDMGMEDSGLLVALAYPERIAKAVDNIGNYRLASGDSVRIDSGDSVAAHEWIVAASLNAVGDKSGGGHVGRVFLAVPIDIDGIVDAFCRHSAAGSLLAERNVVAWDAKQGCVAMRRESRIGRLTISESQAQDVDLQEIVAVVCEAVKKHGLAMLDWDEDVRRLQQRVAQVASWHPQLGIPDLSTPYLMQTAQQWLPFYIENQGRALTTVAELRKLNLCEVLWNIIPYDIQQYIDRFAPTHIQVPTGSRIRIDYRQGAEAPVLSVRLQECFGMSETPCVDGGKRPLLMELLSPGYKPVQLTQDLRSFWQNTYFEVRKELKRRYPKHYWPENPLEAEAVRGVIRKK